MSDQAFQLLLQKITGADASSQQLWLIDENLGEDDLSRVQPRHNLQVMTNRCDLSIALERRGFKPHLSDYDLSVFAADSLDLVFYRVSKEKAIVHHIINSAADCLKPGGLLVLAGYKNEGIKTYISKAADYLGGSCEKQRGANSAILAEIQRSELVGDPLDDKNYRELIDIEHGATAFYSKPGVYGWNKVDQGSAFFIEHFADFLSQLKGESQRVADIGCGYGFLSIMASKQLQAEFIATDNNIAAVALCRKNFERHAVSGDVVLADCADSIEGGFDVVLCNPPFHQGFSVDGDLTVKFLAAAKRLLRKGGSALFVVNSFIPLEKKAKGLFSEISTLASNGSFKLVMLRVG